MSDDLRVRDAVAEILGALPRRRLDIGSSPLYVRGNLVLDRMAVGEEVERLGALTEDGKLSYGVRIPVLGNNRTSFHMEGSFRYEGQLDFTPFDQPEIGFTVGYLPPKPNDEDFNFRVAHYHDPQDQGAPKLVKRVSIQGLERGSNVGEIRSLFEDFLGKLS